MNRPECLNFPFSQRNNVFFTMLGDHHGDRMAFTMQRLPTATACRVKHFWKELAIAKCVSWGIVRLFASILFVLIGQFNNSIRSVSSKAFLQHLATNISDSVWDWAKLLSSIRRFLIQTSHNNGIQQTESRWSENCKKKREKRKLHSTSCLARCLLYGLVSMARSPGLDG